MINRWQSSTPKTIWHTESLDISGFKPPSVDELREWLMQWPPDAVVFVSEDCDILVSWVKEGRTA